MLKRLLKIMVIQILILEARLVLKKYKPRIIAVTGNVGKTGAKDAIATVLEPHLFVRASEKSYNSEIGVPLAILGCGSGWGDPIAWLSVFTEGLALIFLKNHYPEWLVLEVGADHPGDIQRITKWLTPDIVVVTRFGETPVHVEFFPSRGELIREKAYLVEALRGDGMFVVNADDADAYALRERTKARCVTYGWREEAVMRASDEHIQYGPDGNPVGMQMKAIYKGNVFPVTIYGTLGKPMLYSALAALAVGGVLGLNMVSLVSSLNNFRAPRGRMRIISGARGSVVIDDSYNASPTAARAALETLYDLKASGRKVAALGDMLELGKESAQEHKKIGAYAAEVCDFLVTVGARAEFFADGARAKKMLVKQMKHFRDAEAAGEFLKGFLEEGDVVLVKGSQAVRLEKAVKEILAEPERAGELLVRQEKEWERR